MFSAVEKTNMNVNLSRNFHEKKNIAKKLRTNIEFVYWHERKRNKKKTRPIPHVQPIIHTNNRIGNPISQKCILFVPFSKIIQVIYCDNFSPRFHVFFATQTHRTDKWNIWFDKLKSVGEKLWWESSIELNISSLFFEDENCRDMQTNTHVAKWCWTIVCQLFNKISTNFKLLTNSWELKKQIKCEESIFEQWRRFIVISVVKRTENLNNNNKTIFPFHLVLCERKKKKRI